MTGLTIILEILFALGLLVLVLTLWRRYRSSPSDARGMGTVKRLYFYGVCFVSLFMVINGAILLVQVLAESFSGTTMFAKSSGIVAGGIALVVVGFPLWVFHWRMIQVRALNVPAESQTLIRKFYIYLLLGVSLSMAANSIVGLLRWILGVEAFSGYDLGGFIAWLAIWLMHWRLELREGQTTRENALIRQFYIYSVCLISLAALCFGLGRMIYFLLLDGYQIASSSVVFLNESGGAWRPSVRDALVSFVVGGTIWLKHWGITPKEWTGLGNLTTESLILKVYLHICVVVGGVVLTFTALGITLTGIFQWLLSATDERLLTHFEFIPGTIALFSVGTGLWIYHTWLLHEAQSYTEDRIDPAGRPYLYLVMTIGVVLLAVGMFFLVGTILDLLINFATDVTNKDESLERLSTSLSLLVIGSITWLYHWKISQNVISVEGLQETSALARRAHVMFVIGVGVISSLVSASIILFIVLKDILDSDVTLSTINDIGMPLSLILALSIILPYYYSIYRREKVLVSPVSRQHNFARKEVSIIIGAEHVGLVEMIEELLGYSIVVIPWIDDESFVPDMTRNECREIAIRVAETPGRRVTLIASHNGLDMYSHT